MDISSLMAKTLARVAQAPQAAPPVAVVGDPALARLVAQGVPVRSSRLALGDLEETPALIATRRWMASGEHCLLALAGAKGIGKTVAAAWAMAQPRRSNPAATAPGLFITAAALARIDRYEAGAVDAVLKASMLVVDDIGVEFNDAKGAFASLFDEALGARYGNELPTVITTNLGEAKFIERFGARIVDRFDEAGVWFERGGESLRGKANAP